MLGLYNGISNMSVYYSMCVHVVCDCIYTGISELLMMVAAGLANKHMHVVLYCVM